MIETDLAAQWAARPDFANQIGSWMWFKDAAAQCIGQVARRCGVRCELRSGVLAEAFFEWASTMDAVQRYAAVDRIDYGHYAGGALLRSLLHACPIQLIQGGGGPAASASASTLFRELRWPEDFVLLCVVLTFLQAWRLHHGAPALDVDEDALRRSWNSFHENVQEDSTTAVAFLDLFLGLPPNFQYPMDISSRPAMVRGLHPH